MTLAPLFRAVGTGLLCLHAGAALAAPVRAPRVIAAVRLPYTSSASPAVGDVDGDGRPDVAVTVDHIGDKTRPRDDPANVNAVALYRWRNGALRPVPGWPQATRDATLALALADLSGDGRDDVLAACGQDWAPDLMTRADLWLTSRLYVWDGSGKAVPPWYPTDEDSLTGLVYGHAYAAPVAADLDGDGKPEILHASQGAWGGTGFQRGGLRIWTADARVYAQTQTEDSRLPWRALPGFSMDAPPVVADLDGDGRWEVVAPSYTGTIHAWDAKGRAMPGWLPSAGARTRLDNDALLRAPIVAVDLDGDGRDEIVAGGYDGALYAWDGMGRRLFRSQLPATDGPPPAITSGLAAGRLRRNYPREWNIVAGDMAGGVTAWRPDGGILWRAQTTPGMPVMAEPAIGDVNADGVQDVVVGGTDGYMYAFDGETGALLWQAPTFWHPTPGGMRLEGVFGAPALADLTGNGHLHIIIATAGRYIVDVPTATWQGFGHLMALDCGPGTYDASRLDWPQYRQNARRTGRAAARNLPAGPQR